METRSAPDDLVGVHRHVLDNHISFVKSLGTTQEIDQATIVLQSSSNYIHAETVENS
jgi:hypothetical protein